MKGVLTKVVVALLIFTAVGGAFTLTSNEVSSAPLYNYVEECNNEGCNFEEVRELYASYHEECIGEGWCSFEEKVELAGGRATAFQSIQQMCNAFRSFGFGVLARDCG